MSYPIVYNYISENGNASRYEFSNWEEVKLKTKYQDGRRYIVDSHSSDNKFILHTYPEMYGPAIKSSELEFYINYGVLHRVNGAAEIYQTINGKEEHYWYDGQSYETEQMLKEKVAKMETTVYYLGFNDEPMVKNINIDSVEYDPDSNKYFYIENGTRYPVHAGDGGWSINEGPKHGRISWIVHGYMHRIDGPAFIHSTPTYNEEYYVFGHMVDKSLLNNGKNIEYLTKVFEIFKNRPEVWPEFARMLSNTAKLKKCVDNDTVLIKVGNRYLYRKLAEFQPATPSVTPTPAVPTVAIGAAALPTPALTNFQENQFNKMAKENLIKDLKEKVKLVEKKKTLMEAVKETSKFKELKIQLPIDKYPTDLAKKVSSFNKYLDKADSNAEKDTYAPDAYPEVSMTETVAKEKLFEFGWGLPATMLAIAGLMSLKKPSTAKLSNKSALQNIVATEMVGVEK